MRLLRRGIGMKGMGLALTLGVGLVGCAVLTVDVDVYKGSLVNEEHVQLHQLTALATAAKPMLVQLRDSLEWPSQEMPEATCTGTDTSCKDTSNWYKPEYIELPKDPANSSKYPVPPQMGWWCKRNDWFCSTEVLQYPYFRNVMAVRTNEVLGLYDTLNEQGKKIPPTDKKAGLTYRIDHYLELSRASDHSVQADPEKHYKKLMDAEHRLIDALVEFAAKVLFLANHEGLLSPPETPGLILGGAEKLNRGLFGDFITDHSMYALLNSELAREKRQQYVRVLQAVGNSILFSANELRERDRHREQGERKVAAEVAAAKSVYSPDPVKVTTDLLAELEHEKQGAQTELDAAKVRKNELEEDIGRPTAPKTGLHAEQDMLVDEVTKADANLKGYRNSLDTLKAIHEALTDDVIQKVISKWGASPPNAKNEREFLRNGGSSLEVTLRSVHKGGSNWDDVLKHLASSDTSQDFEDYRKQFNESSLEPKTLVNGFVEYIKWLIAERTKRNEKQAKLDGNKRDIVTLGEEVKALETQINNTLSKGKADFETAKTQIEAVKADVLKGIDWNRPYVFPQEVYAQIDAELKKIKTPESKTAQAVLASRRPPPGMPPLNPKGYKSPAEVMDGVIALLRHQQMDAVARFGKDSIQAEKATEAIENAYRHRAGMIYIRPSSAYLRTSFPSTSLQDDPNLAWDNMLLKQGLRNLPFSSELRDILDPSGKQDRSITSELDKQYWQNINRVRVSGAGATNQALVKDDVGNWYVKQYFGDTERIWESAKNLALFSMSAKVPIDLAKQLNNASTPEEYAENSKETPTLQKVLEKHHGAYQTHTDEVKAKLEGLHTKNDKSELQETMIAAWEAHDGIKKATSFKASLIGELKTEIRRWDEAAKALKDNANQDPGQVIVKDVRALSRLDTMLSASIAKMPPSDATDEVKQTAMKEVHKVVGGQVTDILTDRTRALDQYEQAIVFIGDAANPKETKEANSTSEPLTYKDIRK